MAEPALDFSLPHDLLGLSAREREAFFALPWQFGVVDDLPTKDASFIIRAGRIENENGEVISPAQGICGIRPFTRVEQQSYIDRSAHHLAYIDSNELVSFFLQNPRAMESYVGMQSHIGQTILTEWRQFPTIYGITSRKVSWQSIHLAMGIAVRHANEAKKKTIYLEWQSEKLSIFSLLREEPPTALVQSNEEDLGSDLGELVEQRTSALSDNVDILNLHFLSIWRLTPPQWAALYWQLKEKYDAIIVHAGAEGDEFFRDQCHVIFDFGEEIDADSEPSPIGLTYRVSAQKSASEGLPVYPVQSDGDMSVDRLPHKLDAHDGYFRWLRDNFGHAFSRTETYVFGDSFNNPAGLLAALNLLNEQHEDNLFKNTFCLFEGISVVLGSLASTAPSWEEYRKVVGRLHKKNFLGLFKPIYPTSGIFSQKPARKYLNNIFGAISQQFGSACLLAHEQAKGELRLLANGSVVENIMRSAFPPGMMEGREARLASSHPGLWVNELAMLFRLGRSPVTFFRFAGRRPYLDDNLAERLLLSRASTTPDSTLDGKMARVINVPVTDMRSDIWKNADAVYAQLEKLLVES